MSKYVWAQTYTVLPSDCDGLGHMNNVAYLCLAEALAWAHSQALGLGLEDYQRLDCAMMAREHVLIYHKPCFAGDVLQLQTWLSANDGLRLRREYRFELVQSATLVFSGHTDWVCVQLSTGRPKRMPQVFQDAYRIQH